jgi:DNA-binding NtrC family response regulator
MTQDSLEVLLIRSRDISCRIPELCSKGSGHESPRVIALEFHDGSESTASLQSLKRDHPSDIIVALVPNGAVSLAVKATRAGADDVVESPLDDEKIRKLLGQRARFSTGNAFEDGATNYGRLGGRSPVMRQLFRRIGSVAPLDTTVLISGESGSGKEVVAREIHARSSRHVGAFVAINCGAIPDSLIESELFGHEKGAFTSAVRAKAGLVELADNGTLFLDEVGDLSLSAQVKILRFLQEREFRRVGGEKTIRVNTRVIAASNKDLEELVREGNFRSDLLYRLNVVNIVVPSLRERPQDLELLIAKCQQRLSLKYGGKRLSFSSDALRVISEYRWSGNVRELENMIEHLLALHVGAEVGVNDLPVKIRRCVAASIATPRGDEIDTSKLALSDIGRVLESKMIREALERNNYIQSKAARALGITRRILKYKMDKLGISAERSGSRRVTS